MTRLCAFVYVTRLVSFRSRLNFAHKSSRSSQSSLWLWSTKTMYDTSPRISSGYLLSMSTWVVLRETKYADKLCTLSITRWIVSPLCSSIIGNRKTKSPTKHFLWIEKSKGHAMIAKQPWTPIIQLMCVITKQNKNSYKSQQTYCNIVAVIVQSIWWWFVWFSIAWAHNDFIHAKFHSETTKNCIWLNRRHSTKTKTNQLHIYGNWNKMTKAFEGKKLRWECCFNWHFEEITLKHLSTQDVGKRIKNEIKVDCVWRETYQFQRNKGHCNFQKSGKLVRHVKTSATQHEIIRDNYFLKNHKSASMWIMKQWNGNPITQAIIDGANGWDALDT